MDERSFQIIAPPAAAVQPWTHTLVSGKPEQTGLRAALPVQVVQLIAFGAIITLLIDLLIGIL